MTLVCWACAGHAAGDERGALVNDPRTLRDRYDVVVVGAGTGGVAASLQAARLGASVLLVEATDWVGGQMAAAGVTSMDEGYPPRDRVRTRGVYGEFYKRAVAHYRALGKSTDTCSISEDHFAVEPRVARRLLHDMIRETRHAPQASGGRAVLDVVLPAAVLSLDVQDSVVRGVRLEATDARGAKLRRSIASHVVIDATEYGDLIPMTGAPYRVGILCSDRPSAATSTPPPVQPITWTAVVKQYPGGTPAELALKSPPPEYNPDEIRAYLSPESRGGTRYPWGWTRFVQYRGMPNSASPIDAQNGTGAPLSRTHINFPANDQPMCAQELESPPARADIERRAKLRTLGMLYFVQNEMGKPDWSVANDEGYDSPYNLAQTDILIRTNPDLAEFREVLNHFPVMPYVRESRRIVGIKTLTAKQLRRNPPNKPAHFATAVAIGDYPVDLHGEHVDRDLQVELELDEPIDLPQHWIQWGLGPFQVPFEAFIPERLDGFLPAEKNLSQSRIASGATRLQPITMLTGQAAGAIAAFACRLDRQPRDVPPMAVQLALLKAGDVLSTVQYSDIPKDTALWQAVQLTTLYRVVAYPEPTFNETAAPTREEIASVREKLIRFEAPGANDAWREAIPPTLSAKTRGDLVRLAAKHLTRTLRSATP